MDRSFEEQFWAHCQSLLMDEASDEDSSCEQEEQEQAPLRRKRRAKRSLEEIRQRKNLRRRRDFFHIHIPKIDIRKRISTMFVNAINAWNMPLLERFLKRYCREDLALTSYTNRIKYSPLLTLVKGCGHVVHYASSFANCIPDACMRMHTTEIRTKSMQSIIISEITYEGTIMYKPKSMEQDARFTYLLEHGNAIVQGESGLKAVGPDAAELERILHQCIRDDSRFSELEPLPVPVPYRRSGCLILKLDQNDLVESVDIVDACSSAFDYYQPLQCAVYSKLKL